VASSSSGLSGGAIAGIVVGCVVGVLLCCLLLFCCLGTYRNKATKYQPHDNPSSASDVQATGTDASEVEMEEHHAGGGEQHAETHEGEETEAV